MQPPELPDGPKDSPFVQTLQWPTHPFTLLIGGNETTASCRLVEEIGAALVPNLRCLK